jgi:hypothetical protein
VLTDGWTCHDAEAWRADTWDGNANCWAAYRRVTEVGPLRDYHPKRVCSSVFRVDEPAAHGGVGALHGAICLKRFHTVRPPRRPAPLESPRINSS